MWFILSGYDGYFGSGQGYGCLAVAVNPFDHMLLQCGIETRLLPNVTETEGRFSMGVLAELAGDENSGEGARTFVFEDEGHTLGNSLRTIISRYPEVDFCGYTIPHPTENKLHFRIQSRHSRAIDVLKRGLEDLDKLCDHTIKTFEDEINSFNSNKVNS